MSQLPENYSVDSCSLIWFCALMQVIDEDSKTSTDEESATGNEHGSSSDTIDEVVYQIDYHGVTTHPSPTPKHPTSP